MLSSGSGAVFWLVLSVVLFIIEGVSVQLLTIWFAIGALLAMAVSLLGGPAWLQILVFVVSSVGVLVVGRPIIKDKLLGKQVPTNADQVIGTTGMVLEDIDNRKQVGRVRANGLDWTARTELDEMVIPSGCQVRILRIEGVKLIVRPLEQYEEEQ